MYLMEGRKLLDTNVFHGRQETDNPIVTNIAVPWVFELKSIHSPTSFCRKKYSQFDRKKEIEAMKEERNFLFVCYILDIHYSLNSIIQ